MPTIALANSVSYNALDKAGLDAVKTFPPIRVFGTVGFIVSMWIVDLSGWQTTSIQFLWSGILSVVLALYSMTMPKCETSANKSNNSFVQALGLELDLLLHLLNILFRQLVKHNSFLRYFQSSASFLSHFSTSAN